MRTRPVLWLVASLGGVLVGFAAFLVNPLPIGPGSSASSDGPSSPAASQSPSSPPASSPPSTEPPSTEPPAFTRLALLQTEEFLERGWGRADRTSIYDGIGAEAPSLCAAPKKLGAGAEEAYAAEYEGLQTVATERVVRYPTVPEAESRFDRLTDRLGRCDAAAGRRADIGTRHEPKLDGVDQAVWWELDLPASADRPTAEWGVLGLGRIDDRIVYLVLTSPTQDPVETVKFEALLRQAARRLV